MHVKQIVALTVCLALAPLVSADERSPSIMFDDPGDPGHLTTLPSPVTGQADRCVELGRKVDALKGHPQQRYAAKQQYEAECRR